MLCQVMYMKISYLLFRTAWGRNYYHCCLQKKRERSWVACSSLLSSEGTREVNCLIHFQIPPPLTYSTVHATWFSLFSWLQLQPPQQLKPQLWNLGSQLHSLLSIGSWAPRVWPECSSLLEHSCYLAVSCAHCLVFGFVLSSTVSSLYYNLTFRVIYYLPRVRVSWDGTVSRSCMLSFVTVPRWFQALRKPIIPIFWSLSWPTEE